MTASILMTGILSSRTLLVTARRYCWCTKVAHSGEEDDQLMKNPHLTLFTSTSSADSLEDTSGNWLTTIKVNMRCCCTDNVYQPIVSLYSVALS